MHRIRRFIVMCIMRQCKVGQTVLVDTQDALLLCGTTRPCGHSSRVGGLWFLKEEGDGDILLRSQNKK